MLYLKYFDVFDDYDDYDDFETSPEYDEIKKINKDFYDFLVINGYIDNYIRNFDANYVNTSYSGRKVKTLSDYLKAFEPRNYILYEFNWDNTPEGGMWLELRRKWLKYLINKVNVKEGMEKMLEYPYQYNTIDNPSDRGFTGNITYYKKVKTFQYIQEELKNIIKENYPELDNKTINNIVNEMMMLGGNKSAEIRKISDNCKDIKKCSKEIYDKFFKYVEV